MSLQEQQQLEDTYVMRTFGRKPVEFVRGKGVRLFDSQGNEYLDLLSGIGAVCLGHANEVVARALAEQAAELVHVSNYFYIPGRGELARSLSHLLNEGDPALPAWKTFFANSGAEANEGAIKLARKYGKLHLDGAGTVLSALRSFHGRTLATTAATGQEAKQESFAPMPAGFAHFEPDNVASLQELIQARILLAAEQKAPHLAPAAVLLECIQGEGGVWPLDPGYLRQVEELAGAHGLLLIVDEVQSGFYRTGRPFAFQHAAIRPQVVCLAKGIANGFPMGALAACGVAADILVAGEHGSTFGGSPLAVAAANATLAELEGRALGANAVVQGAYLMKALAGLAQVTEVRGRGLMVGASLAVPRAAAVADQLLARGVVVGTAGPDILRFLPPLCISTAELDECLTHLSNVLEQL